jgi:FG-GAP-like repeat
MKQLLFVAVFATFVLKAMPQSIDFSTCPTCSSTDIAEFTEINTKYLGVKGYNPSRPSTYNLIGDNKFTGVGGILNPGDLANGKNWYPLRTRKQILKGKIFSFSVHPLGEENDWNTHISPSTGFEDFMEDAKKSHTPNGEWDMYKDAKKKYTIEAEITPRAVEFNNRWFNNVDGKTYLVGREICAYGPFVSEESHGHRPEIHPSEQIWWKEDDNKTMILLVADASNRFDNDSDYEDENAETGWHPWTQDKGQEAELSIPFEIENGKGALYYNLQAIETPNFYEEANYADASTGTKYTITYKGKPVLTVAEPLKYDKYIGITFKDVCYNSSTNKLHGLIVIKTAIGNGGGGKEGFVALQIDKQNTALYPQQGLVTGNIIGTSNTWTSYNKNYDDYLQFGSTIISSDKHGEGIVDRMIDFDGNGITDLFTSATGKWMVMYDAKGKWTEINNSNVHTSALRFGDIDGDKKTDVMYVNSSHRLQVSFGGIGGWRDYSNVEGLDYTNARVGDFDGDGKTDIIKRVDKNINIMYSCNGSWEMLAEDFKFYVGDWEHRMRFGDFNGDGKTDIFRYYQGKFQYYDGGKSHLKPLCTPLIKGINVKNNLLFVNSLSKKGFTDIIYVKPSNNAWKIYYEGKTTSAGRILKYRDVNNICFGNFNPNELWEPITMDFIQQVAIPNTTEVGVEHN